MRLIRVRLRCKTSRRTLAIVEASIKRHLQGCIRMKLSRFVTASTIALVILVAGAFAQQTTSLVKTALSQSEIDRIVQNAVKNEQLFREALGGYVFKRSAQIQTVGMGGQITGTFRRDSFMALTPDGQRFEKILFAPISTLTEIQLTPEDLDDLGGINPFAIEPSKVAQYNFAFVGKEKIDELNLFVFDVTPKVIPDPKRSKSRLFSGRIWVDDVDLKIVKSRGKGLPEWKDNKFPVVETWRENIDGKYWFPSYISSDDQLVFDNGSVVKMKIRVRYTDYAQGQTDVKVLDEEEEVKEKPSPTPTPIKKP